MFFPEGKRARIVRSIALIWCVKSLHDLMCHEQMASMANVSVRGHSEAPGSMRNHMILPQEGGGAGAGGGGSCSCAGKAAVRSLSRPILKTLLLICRGWRGCADG
jgi:hypothetical protein